MMANEIKKPRLFYYEEAVSAWIPAPERVENIIDVDCLDHDGTSFEIDFKRIDMTDREYDNLPEAE